MSDREKLRLIYELLDGVRTYKYEDITKWKLFKLKEEIYNVLIGKDKNEEAIYISNKSRYQETIF